MTDREPYAPGPASGAQVRKDGEKWTLLLVREGAAGWHICFDVLERLLAGEPIGRIVGAEAMKFGGWQRLNAEYANQSGVEAPGWPPKAPKR